MTADDPLYVVAGNYQQYVHWCLDRQMSPRDRAVRYVGTGYGLRGVDRGLRYTLVGTYWDRRDWPEIDMMLALRDAVPA